MNGSAMFPSGTLLRHVFITACIGFSLSLTLANGSTASADDTQYENASSRAEQHLSLDEFIGREYGKTTMKMFAERVKAHGIDLSESTTSKLMSENADVHREAKREILDAMTARFGEGGRARSVIAAVMTAKELTDGLEKYRRTSVRPSNAHTNNLIDRILSRAGSSDPQPLLDRVTERPRRTVVAFVDDLNRLVRDGTRSSDDETNIIFDSVHANAAASGMTLQQLADDLNRIRA